MPVNIHKKDDFEPMRKAGQIAAQTLDFITEYVKPGTTTNQINDLCHDFITSMGGIPAPLNYEGFPKSVCTSVNHVVCHGIPSGLKLKDGDIINIDVTVKYDGWHGDTSRMYFAGSQVPIKARRLVDITYRAMMAAIDLVKPGVRLGDIGHVIEHMAHKNGFSVVEDFGGHGIGKVFHEDPHIKHFGKAGTGMVIKEGMFFTIEPMINAGKKGVIVSKLDGWTATTRDKKLSAQFEHTIGVTKDGCEIFTLSPKKLHYPPYNI